MQYFDSRTVHFAQTAKSRVWKVRTTDFLVHLGHNVNWAFQRMNHGSGCPFSLKCTFLVYFGCTERTLNVYPTRRLERILKICWLQLTSYTLHTICYFCIIRSFQIFVLKLTAWPTSARFSQTNFVWCHNASSNWHGQPWWSGWFCWSTLPSPKSA